MTSSRHAPMQSATRRKRRQLALCLGVAVLLAALYPSVRDRLHARDYIARLGPGQVLQATPQLYNPLFRNSDWLIVAHNEYGTWAVALGIPWQDGLERMAQRSGDRVTDMADTESSWWGGPMIMERSVWLRPGPSGYPIMQPSDRRMASPATDVNAWQFRGHAGWQPGQLAREIRHGSWQVPADATPLLARHGWPYAQGAQP